MERYVDALLEEMDARRQEHQIRTVYIGGGTPSIMPIEQMARLVEGLRLCFDLSQLEEATIECNPEDMTPQYLADLHSLGLFNRLSVGVQSLDDDVLHLVGRRHTSNQAVDAVSRARAIGFDNISVDLIYGIKELDELDSGDDLGGLVDMASHVSAYALTVEEGTPLAVQVEKGLISLPGDDEVVRQYYAMHDFLASKGFEQYEVSNYCRPGFRSRHNSRYWDRTPYLGLGAAAHSFDGCRRRWNVADVDRYISTHDYEEETLTKRDAYNELLMTSLRTVAGLQEERVPEQYRKSLQIRMRPYMDCGWVRFVADGRTHFASYVPTTDGLLHADGIAADLFVE